MITIPQLLLMKNYRSINSIICFKKSITFLLTILLSQFFMHGSKITEIMVPLSTDFSHLNVLAKDVIPKHKQIMLLLN